MRITAKVHASWMPAGALSKINDLADPGARQADSI